MLRMLAAIPTPFGSDCGPDLDAFGAHLQWLLERGLDGAFVGGTTGEGVLLEPDEVVALVGARGRRRGRRAGDRPGRAAEHAATVALLERAYGAGAARAAAYVPWFYPATDDQVRRHFLALLEAAGGHELLGYTIPRMHVNVLAAAVLGAPAAAGLAGMKDSTGDPECHRAFVAAVAGRPFRIYSGSDQLALGAYAPAGTGRSRRSPRPARICSRRSGEALAADDDEAADRASAALAAEKERSPARGRRSRRSSGAAGRPWPSAGSTTPPAPGRRSSDRRGQD